MNKTLLLVYMFCCSFFGFSQVGISTTNPHISAELDVSSVSRGLLVPRLTTAAITTLSTAASEGLIVFDTNKKQFVGWDGSKWQVLVMFLLP